MFQNIFQAYDGTTATLEIFIMLAGAFLLGWLFCHVWCGCCKGGSCQRTDDGKVDDLTVIEGVGPKIAKLLNDEGIYSWKALANTPKGTLTAVLEKAGSRFRMHDPSTWAKQADLAAKGKWKELEKLQDRLQGGK